LKYINVKTGEGKRKGERKRKMSCEDVFYKIRGAI